MTERNRREELKREFLRGIEKAKVAHQGCNETFLGIIYERLSTILDEIVDMREAEDEIEKILKLIEEYTDGRVSIDELKDREYNKVLSGEDRVSIFSDDDVVSLLDFVRDDQ